MPNSTILLATEAGTRSICPAVINLACSGSPSRNLAQYKSLLSISTLKGAQTGREKEGSRKVNRKNGYL